VETDSDCGPDPVEAFSWPDEVPVDPHRRAGLRRPDEDPRQCVTSAL
jgi:hypothetical protein